MNPFKKHPPWVNWDCSWCWGCRMKSLHLLLRLQSRAFPGGLCKGGVLHQCCTSTAVGRVIAGLLLLEGSLSVPVSVLLELPELCCSALWQLGRQGEMQRWPTLIEGWRSCVKPIALHTWAVCYLRPTTRMHQLHKRASLIMMWCHTKPEHQSASVLKNLPVEVWKEGGVRNEEMLLSTRILYYINNVGAMLLSLCRHHNKWDF